MYNPSRFWLTALWVVLVLAACGTPTPDPGLTPDPTQNPLPTSAPVITLTALPPTFIPTLTPTLTPEPLAARVNGQGIRLVDYEAEVQRCQAGRVTASMDASTCAADALHSLIENAVVEQAAHTAGLSVSEDELAADLAQVTAAQGGADQFNVWLSATAYTADSYRVARRAEMLRSKLAAHVAAGIGDTAEQIHARAILVADETSAQSLLAQVNGGADFATLAVNNSLDLGSRVAGGDLGWFPRGTLTQPELETAAFALETGQTSAVIPTAFGYAIVQVIERDPARPLTPPQQTALRALAFRSWLNQQLAQATIEQLITP